jgi:hypothetical protein
VVTRWTAVVTPASLVGLLAGIAIDDPARQEVASPDQLTRDPRTAFRGQCDKSATKNEREHGEATKR